MTDQQPTPEEPRGAQPPPAPESHVDQPAQMQPQTPDAPRAKPAGRPRPGAGTLAVAAAASGFAFGAVVFGMVRDGDDAGNSGDDEGRLRLIDRIGDGYGDDDGYEEHEYEEHEYEEHEYEEHEYDEGEEHEYGEREWDSDEGARPGEGFGSSEPRTSTRGS